MAFLIIDTLQAVGVAASVPVTVELTDGRGDSVTGYVTASAEVIVFPTVVTTDANGHVDIDVVPNEDITPGGTCYTVRIAEKQFLIRKSASNQTLLDAIITDVSPLDPVETNDLLDHINDPFNAHGASAISVIPNADLLGENVQGALEELQQEILDHQDDLTGAHEASSIAVTPTITLDADNVQDALEEVQLEVVDVTVDLAAHKFDISDAHAASAISFGPVPDIISGNVQDAIVEVDSELHSHVDEIADAHDASAISVVPFETIAATDVQSALEELFNEASGSGASTAADVSYVPGGSIEATDVQTALEEIDNDGTLALTAHLTDSSGAHDASAISAVPFGTVASSTVQEQIEEVYTLAVVSLDEASEISFDPAGNIAATDVQAAIEELDAEKADYFDTRIVRSDDAWTATKEPLGFPSVTDNTISVVNAGATYTFSNTPTGVSFDVWAGVAGSKYTFTTPQTLTLAKVTGGVYIYYNASGVLSQSSVKWGWDTDAPVAFFYYSATAGGFFLIDERHGTTMDNDTQQYLSEVVGSRLVSGLVMGSYTLTPPSPVNADNQFSTTAGLLVDADIQYTLPAVAAGGGAGLYGIFYRTGTTEWTVAASSVPVSVGTTYPRWSQNVAGTWQLTEAANGDFLNMWLMAVPVPAPGQRSYVLIPGEAVHANLVDALAESEFTSALLGSFPFSEAVARYKITIQCSSAYSSATGRFRIRNVAELSGTAINNAASAEIIDHSILLNRDLAGQHPASAITFTPYSTLASTDVQSVIQELLDEGTPATATSTTFTPTGDIAATNVQDAIVEVDTELHAHEADTVDAHDASAISFVPTGTVSSSTAQAAIAEVATDAAADLTAHVTDSTDAHAASAIGFTPTGNIAATTVQNAVAEVATDANALYIQKFTTLAAGSSVMISSRTGDVGTRFQQDIDGKLQWADGTAAIDTNLYRGAADQLKTDDDLYIAGGNVGIGIAPASTAALILPTGTAPAQGILFDGDTNLYRSAADTLTTDDKFTSGNRIQAALSTTAGGFQHGSTGPLWIAGTGSPESVVTAPVGSIFSRTDGTAANGSQYAKRTGSGNTGWVIVDNATAVQTGTPSGTPSVGDFWVDTDDVAPAYVASNVTFSPTGDIVATNVQSAIAEVDTELHAHETDTSAAHAASAIGLTAVSHLTGTDVQTAMANVAKGIFSRQITSGANTTTTVTAVLTGLSLTITADDTRLYRVFFGSTVTQTAADQWDFFLRENGTTLGLSSRFFSAIGFAAYAWAGQILYEPTSGSKTLTVTMSHATGANTATSFGATHLFYVEDVGPR